VSSKRNVRAMLVARVEKELANRFREKNITGETLGKIVAAIRHFREQIIAETMGALKLQEKPKYREVSRIIKKEGPSLDKKDLDKLTEQIQTSLRHMTVVVAQLLDINNSVR